jgi:hypothetical protein
MAFSSSVNKQDVVGSMKVQIYSCDFAAVTTGAIKTGFSNIFAAVFNNGTTEAQGLVKINIAADGSTAEVGTVNVSGVTSNDVGQLIVFGV